MSSIWASEVARVKCKAMEQGGGGGGVLKFKNRASALLHRSFIHIRHTWGPDICLTRHYKATKYRYWHLYKGFSVHVPNLGLESVPSTKLSISKAKLVVCVATLSNIQRMPHT